MCQVSSCAFPCASIVPPTVLGPIQRNWTCSLLTGSPTSWAQRLKAMPCRASPWCCASSFHCGLRLWITSPRRLRRCLLQRLLEQFREWERHHIDAFFLESGGLILRRGAANPARRHLLVMNATCFLGE